MAEAERVRIEVAFTEGQSLSVNVSPQTADELEAALRNGEPEAVALEAEDGRYTIILRSVAFLKRHVRESRVGFGA